MVGWFSRQRWSIVWSNSHNIWNEDGRNAQNNLPYDLELNFLRLNPNITSMLCAMKDVVISSHNRDVLNCHLDNVENILFRTSHSMENFDEIKIFYCQLIQCQQKLQISKILDIKQLIHLIENEILPIGQNTFRLKSNTSYRLQ